MNHPYRVIPQCLFPEVMAFAMTTHETRHLPAQSLSLNRERRAVLLQLHGIDNDLHFSYIQATSNVFYWTALESANCLSFSRFEYRRFSRLLIPMDMTNQSTQKRECWYVNFCFFLGGGWVHYVTRRFYFITNRWISHTSALDYNQGLKSVNSIFLW